MGDVVHGRLSSLLYNFPIAPPAPLTTTSGLHTGYSRRGNNPYICNSANAIWYYLLTEKLNLPPWPPTSYYDKKKKKNTRCELGYDTIGWIDIFHIGVFILLIKTKTTHSSEVRYWWYVHSQTYSVEVHLGWEFLGYIMTDRAWENWIEMLQTLRTRLSSLCLPLVRQVHPSTFLISRSDEANFSHPQNLISDRRRV